MHPPRVRAARLAARTEQSFRLLDMLDAFNEDEEFKLTNLYIIRRRSSLLLRERSIWATCIKPMHADKSCKDRFRM